MNAGDKAGNGTNDDFYYLYIECSSSAFVLEQCAIIRKYFDHCLETGKMPSGQGFKTYLRRNSKYLF